MDRPVVREPGGRAVLTLAAMTAGDLVTQRDAGDSELELEGDRQQAEGETRQRLEKARRKVVELVELVDRAAKAAQK